MTQTMFKDLAIETLKTPDVAARHILGLRLEKDVLWIALALAVVLNTFLLSLQNVLVSPSDALPALFASPMLYMFTVGVGQIVFIYAVWLAGTWLNGRGTLPEVMSVLVWLQMMQVAVQAILVVLSVTAPALAVLLNMVALVYGLYILAHFIKEAHQLESLLRAAGVIFAALFAIAFSLSLVLSLTGGSQLGLTNV